MALSAVAMMLLPDAGDRRAAAAVARSMGEHGRPVRARQALRIRDRPRLGDHLQRRVGVDQQAQPLPDHRVIVGDHDCRAAAICPHRARF